VSTVTNIVITIDTHTNYLL